MKEKNLRLKLQKKLEFKIGHTQYILHQDRVYKVRMYANDSVLVTDITDAGKTGKVCHELGISTKHSAPTCAIWNEIFRDHWKTIFNLTTSKISPANCFNRDYFNFYLHEIKAIRIMPVDLSVIKPLKEEPKKWTLRHAIRALVNGQFQNLRCKGRYTDDYAFDNAINFSCGIIENAVVFVEKIVESPSGWWVSANQNGQVSICCHHFDSNEFTPKIVKYK